MRNMKAVLVLAGLSLVACGEDLEPKDDGKTPGDSKVVHLDKSNGMTTTRIDAAAEDSWVFLDLDVGGGKEVSADSAGWDLAFQRFAVITNGGESGDGGVAVARLSASEFDALKTAPLDGWMEDRADGDDRDEYADSPFLSPEAWYAYDQATHGLAPADYSYVVHTTEGSFFKIRFTAYYDDAGTAGFPTFQWAAVAGEEN